MHFLLPICGKFTRELQAHQIFYNEAWMKRYAGIALKLCTTFSFGRFYIKIYKISKAIFA
jgi:hypothetical protein